MEKMHSIKPLLANFRIDAPDILIRDLVLDSREVAIHTAFIAIKGHQRDGRDFIPQAVSLGAKVIVSECDSPDEHGEISMREQSLIIAFYGLSSSLSALARDFYGAPAQKLDVIAVTGTNGKTSTVQLATQLGFLLGQRAASIGTLGAGLYQPEEQNSGLKATLNTTPDAIQIQRLIAEFVDCQTSQVALEASSHALVQKRIAALKTDTAVFTNLTRDHLDYHGTMAAYAAAKRQLIDQPGLQNLVINADDGESSQWLEKAAERLNVTLYSASGKIADLPEKAKYCVAVSPEFVPDGCRFTMETSWGTDTVELPLFGAFNIANVLAAVSALLMHGHGFADVVNAVNRLRAVPGRMEIFRNTSGANVVVDYAHTPDALEQVLKAARHHTPGSLVVVFGCGGDRDQGKRPLMGEVAENFADRVILTNDNSRTEAPEQIFEDILVGCRDTAAIQIELERPAAIQRALQQCERDDLIVLAGKGHEDYQIIGNQTLPYNERHYVQNLLEGNGQ